MSPYFHLIGEQPPTIVRACSRRLTPAITPCGWPFIPAPAFGWALRSPWRSACYLACSIRRSQRPLVCHNTSSGWVLHCSRPPPPTYAYRLALPEVTSLPKIEADQPFPLPGLSKLPLVGPTLFNQTPLTVFSFNWLMVAAGSALRWLFLARGGRARRLWTLCFLQPLMPCKFACNKQVSARPCHIRFS